MGEFWKGLRQVVRRKPTDVAPSPEWHKPTPFELSVKEAQHTIATMPWDRMTQLQLELQYALTYYRTGYRLVQDNVNASDFGGEIAAKFLHNGPNAIETIKYSPLYHAVRQRIRTEHEDQQVVPPNWTGWMLSDADATRIARAMITQVVHELPVGHGQGGEGLTPEIRDVQKDYGISGLFVPNPTKVGLIATFHEQWGTRRPA